MWYLSSPTRDQTCAPCIERQSLNHGTAREISVLPIFLNWALLPQFFSLKAILKPHPDSHRGHLLFCSFSSGTSPLLSLLSSSSVAATTHSTLGRIFFSPATNPDGNETSFCFAAREGGHTDSFYPKDSSTQRKRGDQANKPRKLLSSISHGHWSVVAAFLLKLSSSYLFFNIYLFVYLCQVTMPKPLTVWITINCGKLWKRWEYQTTWPASWETYMRVRKQQLELNLKQQTGSK